MDSPQDFKSTQENIQSALVSAVKTVNRIASEDLAFQRTINPIISDELDDRTTRMLGLSTELLRSAAKTFGLDAPALEDADDVDVHWRKIVDVVDTILEKAGTAMDEYTGVLKRKAAPTTDAAPQAKKSKIHQLDWKMRHANMTKPQIAFEHPVDNITPWKPTLTKKPNATVPLEQSLTSSVTEKGFVDYKNPYEPEILQSKYPDRAYKVADPIPYQPVDTTTATWVDTFEGVLEMLKELKQAKEIAVDLEHHDHRSYVGLLSLMQISTREKDWIVDTLKPWRHQLEVLNEVFTDPSIIKVFHGAFMDIQWLQRDLGLYINGLFDTFFACEALNYSPRSLAYLLSRFANFDADKKYQMADWRIRPLPDEMFYYARSDTHYLLYIYDMMRNELVEKSDRSNPEADLIEHVLQKSRDLSLAKYEGQTYDTESGNGTRGWYNMLLKHPMPLSGPQFAVYKAIWEWRDDIARREDESTGFVLPNSTITEIAKRMPPDAKALHALIPHGSWIARKNIEEIWSLYQNAKARGVNGPTLLDLIRNDPRTSFRRPIVDPVVGLEQLSVGSVDDTKPAHLARSQLFGDMPVSSVWEDSPAATGNHEEFIMLPWQRFADEAMKDVVTKQDSAHGASADKMAVTDTPNGENEVEMEDEEFTLKAGTKRKAFANDDDTSSDESSDSEIDIIPTSDEAQSSPQNSLQSDRKLTKKEAKAARIAESKAAKIARKEAKRNAAKLADPEGFAKQQERLAIKENKKAKKALEELEPAAGTEDDEISFDYSQAASVLHGNRKNANPAGVVKRFDPYSKTGEGAPKGARKAPPQRGERSATFKK